MGFPGDSVVKTACNAGYMQETRVQSLGQEDPLKNPTDKGVCQLQFMGSQSLTQLGD